MPSKTTLKLPKISAKETALRAEVTTLKERITLLVEQRNALYDSQATEIVLLKHALKQSASSNV